MAFKPRERGITTVVDVSVAEGKKPSATTATADREDTKPAVSNDEPEVLDAKATAPSVKAEKPAKTRVFQVKEDMNPRIGGMDWNFKKGCDTEAPEDVFLVLRDCGYIESFEK